MFGKCEWCTVRAQLNTVCVCERVRYCSATCMEKDKRYHKSKCSTSADAELQQISYRKSS